MRADGSQLREITTLVDAGVLRPVIDRVFDFAETAAALKYVDTGRAKGKVVVSNADTEQGTAAFQLTAAANEFMAVGL